MGSDSSRLRRGPHFAAPQLADYQDKYPKFCRFRREDGILEISFETDGDTIVWGWEALEATSHMWRDVGADPDNQVIVITGKGEDLISSARVSAPPGPVDAAFWRGAHSVVRRLQTAILDVDVPIIAAITGTLELHAEMFLMSDITLSADTALFRDPHVDWGVVPGDGVHVFWPMAIGMNRARYFMLTQQELTAQQLHEWGVINEVLPKDQVIARAWEHARYLMTKSESVRSYARQASVIPLRRAMHNDLPYGLALEGLGYAVGSSEVPAMEE
jgi:enoyl-CoA hydratase/carnithine racemase